MTFSIAARSSDGAEFGIAISSSSPAVAARCVHVRAGIGAVISQNVSDPALGVAVLDRLQDGADASDALTGALAATPFAQWRQLAVVPPSGIPVVHTGARGLGIHAAAVGADAAAAGNMLADAHLPQAMLDMFAATDGGLAVRLLAALAAGLAAGGEAGPVYSAGLVVVRNLSWPIIDLRVDWHDDPIGQLQFLWTVYAPQAEDYVVRALDPTTAPSFGVPGDP
jgi:uncharacterized Ntn-hydrolase superfamily protein